MALDSQGIDLSPARPGGLVSVHWLSRLREPGAVLVLDGTPWAAIWRCTGGEPVARTWRGPTAVAREAIRGGVAAYRGTLRGTWALYTLSAQGAQAHHAWTAERERLRETIRELRARVAGLEADLSALQSQIEPEAMQVEPVDGLTRIEAAIYRRLERAGKPVSHDDLVAAAAAAGGRRMDRDNLQVVICRIRKHLRHAHPGAAIRTIRGFGYQLLGCPGPAAAVTTPR